MTTNKKTYSSKEVRHLVGDYIDESAQRLQERLRKEWKKQSIHTQKENGYVAHSI